MKKLNIKILYVILALIMAFACVGCSNPLKEDDTPVTPPASSSGPTFDFSNAIPPTNISTVTINYDEDKYSSSAKELSLTSAIDEVYQSVVVINTTAKGSDGETVLGSASGVIVDITTDGDVGQNVCYVFTCYHVVENYVDIEVSLPKVAVAGTGANAYYDYANVDFSTYTFTTKGSNPNVAYVGGDKSTDVAVLKLKLDKYPSLKVTKAPIVNVKKRPYTVGQTVFAVGNSAGYPSTASSGILSFVNRETSVSGIGTMQLLQMDTPINHGNSGGGLFNLYGELVGITNSGHDNYNSIAFAIPATTISATNGITESQDNGFIYIATELIKTAWSDGNGNFNFGYVTGRWKWGIGVSANTNNYPIVTSVETDSIFLNKVAVGDVITGFSYPDKQGGRRTINLNNSGAISAYEYFVNSYDDMKKIVSVGDEIALTVLRNNTTLTVTARLKQTIYRDTGKGLGQ